jgi:hypothetical protein
MKTLVFVVGIFGAFSSILGCSYAGLAASGDKVVVLKNGAFSNSAYVCKVADNGVSNCVEGESP